MKSFYFFIIFLLSALLVLLDVSFFSAISFLDVTFISSYSALIIILILGDESIFYAYSLSVILCFTVLTSLPVWLIILLFFGVPTLVFHFRKNYLPDIAPLFSFFLFVSLNLIFELGLLLHAKELSLKGIEVLGSFTLLNSIFGLILYLLVVKGLNKFYGKSIKVS